MRITITKKVTTVDTAIPTWLTEAIEILMMDGRNISAIKAIRGWMHDHGYIDEFGLKEAKDWIEQNFTSLRPLR